MTMPELPDLLYIRNHLDAHLTGRTIAAAEVRKPVVLRNAVEGDPRALLKGRKITGVVHHGPFLTLTLEPPLEMIINLMLAGRIQHQRPDERAEGHLCLSLLLDDGTRLNIADEQTMAKVYIVPPGDHGRVPKYESQGIDILSGDFTLERFRELASQNGRRQVRVFINDHTVLSAIGNAYADEILFEARIHPKTFVSKLDRAQVSALYEAIRSVMQWGIAAVERAGKPIQVKVRDHMRVRNRHGEPCPRCGATIRREGVRGYDVFFCPHCQPPSRRLFIDWNTGRK